MTEHPAVALARQLVRMPSGPGSNGQPKVAELLADRLHAAGFTVSLQRYAPGHANVVAVLEEADTPALYLTGHLDTVAVAEDQWSVDPYGAVKVDGELWGRGSVDMKSGVAAAVCAAERYALSAADRGNRPVVLVLTAEEEVGCLGAQALVAETEDLPKAGSLLVCEPTSSQPLLGHRGAAWVDLIATGVACHASTPHLGTNAIAGLITSLEAVRAWSEAHPSHDPILGERTLNVGLIEGGRMRNIVPDAARAELDFRVPDPREAIDLPSILQSVVGANTEVQAVLTLSSVATADAEPWVQAVDRTVRELHGTVPSNRAARFFTDASVLTPALGGPPTIILGPGSADRAHTVDERCPLEEIVRCDKMYEAILRLDDQ